MSPSRFESASGLRPASAFLAVGLVLVVVAVQAVRIALAAPGKQPWRLRNVELPWPHFDIVDARGRPLAFFVDRLDLVMSPRAMWQGHTPLPMAAELARVMPGYDVEQLLARMLPRDAENGEIAVELEPLLGRELSRDEALRIARWIKTGSVDPEEPASEIPGMRVVGDDRSRTYQLRWRPALALDATTRERFSCDKATQWTARLSDDLAACLYGPLPRGEADWRERAKERREAVWGALMPTRFRIVVKDVPAVSAPALFNLLATQGVNRLQMSLQHGLTRESPARVGEGDDTSFDLLGRWGFVDAEEARRVARLELSIADEHALDEDRAKELDLRAWELASRPQARSGLERLCERMLRQPDWSDLERRPGHYAFLDNRVARRGSRPYFLDADPAAPTPRVQSTIDLVLQGEMRRVLRDVIDEHDAAVAMGIVLDLATGDVLAVDGIDQYEAAGFLPTYHLFTPGSTAKAVVMATALEAGVVAPDDTFDTHNGHYVVPRSSRVIHEAKGAPIDTITAAAALARSSNAVMVQIGLKVGAEYMRGKLVELGYGLPPRTGLGGERAGSVPRLPWRPHNQHASVSFGHELSVSLWQHATALATIVRGGEHRPLRLVRAVEQGGERYELELEPPRRVYSQRTSELVREMMVLGAREGTGKSVASDALVMGTKTGTTEKVPTELCLHVELEHNRTHVAAGHSRCLAALRGKKAHKRSCYTSSMCAFGRLPGESRELLALVVVDEPRSSKKYGSEVAGQAAVRLLEEGLGVRRFGAPRPPILPDGFGVTTSAEANDAEQPWVELVGERKR